MININSFADSLNNAVETLKQNLVPSAYIIILLWLIQIVNWLCKYRLNLLGIYPRHIFGLVGIMFSPFLHASFEHLFLNSIPLFILVDMMLSYGTHLFYWVCFLIMFQSGMAVWLVGRPALHVGASSVIMGLWGFLLINSYYQPSLVAILLAALCIYYLGSLFFNLLPLDRKASWEGHLFGFLAGISTAFLLPYLQASTLQT